MNDKKHHPTDSSKKESFKIVNLDSNLFVLKMLSVF